MSAILQWAFSLCAAMVAIGLSRMLAPASGMEKTFRFVVSIFFLASLLMPVAIRFPVLMVEIPAHTQTEIDRRSLHLEEVARRQTLAAANNRLERMTLDKLSQRGIKVHFIAINFTTSAEGEVVLEGVELTLDRAHQGEGEALTRYLETELGGSVRLRFAGQEGE